MRVSIRSFAMAGCAAAFMVLACGIAAAAEVRVYASVAVKTALDDLAQRYEKASGNTVVLLYGSGAQMAKRIEAGEAFDVSVNLVEATDALIKTGMLLAAPRPIVGVTVATLAYRTGTPRPEITTPDAFKATIAAASSISVSDPAQGGASAVFFMGQLRKFGLEDAVKDRLKLQKPGEGAAPVGTGATQYGAALSSEVAGVKGASGVPIFPQEQGAAVTLAAAVSSKAAQPDAARALIAFLLTPEAMAVRKAGGLVPD